jgi:hypothetical protein
MRDIHTPKKTNESCTFAAFEPIELSKLYRIFFLSLIPSVFEKQINFHVQYQGYPWSLQW